MIMGVYPLRSQTRFWYAASWMLLFSLTSVFRKGFTWKLWRVGRVELAAAGPSPREGGAGRVVESAGWELIWRG